MHAPTQTGPKQYRLNNLESAGLPKTQAISLLFLANDVPVDEIAKKRNCTPRNIYQALDAIHAKTSTLTKAALVAKSFEKGFLKLLTPALCLSITAAPVLDPETTQRPRPARIRPARNNARREQ